MSEHKETNMISYAQNYEDVILRRVFFEKEQGFYIDVGAADPVDLSVTYWFYQQGWLGINIEPEKTQFQKLQQQRLQDVNLNLAVGNHAGYLPLHVIKHKTGEATGLSTLTEEYASEHLAGKTPFEVEEYQVQIQTLAQICEQHLNGRTIDFLKIDVEGFERQVLEGNDWIKYRPIVILLEALAPQYEFAHPNIHEQENIYTFQEWEDILFSSNYQFVYFDGLNRFYLDNAYSHLKHRFIPPNGFDNFNQIRVVNLEQQNRQLKNKLLNIFDLLDCTKNPQKIADFILDIIHTDNYSITDLIKNFVKNDLYSVVKNSFLKSYQFHSEQDYINFLQDLQQNTDTKFRYNAFHNAIDDRIGEVVDLNIEQLMNSVARYSIDYSQIEAPMKDKPTAVPFPFCLENRPSFEESSQISSKSIYIGNNTAICIIANRFKMYVLTDDLSLAPHLMLNGYWESWISVVFYKYLIRLNPKTIINVGANLGYYSLLAASLCPNAKIYAYEPQPKLANLLHRSSIINGFANLQISQKAVGAKPGLAQLRLFADFYGSAMIDVTDNQQDSISVKLTSLDTDSQEPIDFMLIDAEGFEYEILKGAELRLANSQKIAIILAFSASRYSDKYGFVNWIKEHDLSVHKITYTGDLELVNYEYLFSATETHDILLTKGV